LELENDPTNDLGNHAIAMIHVDKILREWRKRMETGVSVREGEY
jgi:hypothetical protein